MVSTSLPAIASAASQDPLVVDAGSSRQTLGVGDTTLSVSGQAFGGKTPYAYLWTVDGSDDPFTDPESQETTIDLDEFEGTVNITLRVEDAAGTVATDHVLYHNAPEAGTLADETLDVGPGVPDEVLGGSGAVDQQTTPVPVEVPSGTDALVATLTWQEASPGLIVARNDLDLVLSDPSGEEVNPGQGRTAGHPERVTVHDPTPGRWNATVEAFLNAPDDAQLIVTAFDTVDLPDAKIHGPTMFGVLDDQVLHGEPRGPTGTTGAWDPDHDGLTERTTDEVTTDLPVGDHDVRFRATTPAGFEAVTEATVTVTDTAEHAVPLFCSGKPHWPDQPAEFSASGGTCWMHGGHNTYVLDAPVHLVGGTGWVLSVEQGFSPPTEYEQAPVTTPVHIQASTDAQNWTDVATAEYRFLDDVIAGDNRQRIQFEFTADTVTEYLRLHQPRSAAQGLSGFLDRSQIFLLANETDEDPTPPRPVDERTQTLSCTDGDVLEDFFTTHPCWFGGINRYDAPSFFHTYQPGPGTTLAELEGTVQVAPWRTDDWFLPLPSPVHVDLGEPGVSVDRGETEAWADQVTQTRVFVQTSPDGQRWETVDTVPLLFGERAPFETELDHQPARFVRLIPDEHPAFDAYQDQPALHHPEAFLVFSELTLTGMLPATSR